LSHGANVDTTNAVRACLCVDHCHHKLTTTNHWSAYVQCWWDPGSWAAHMLQPAAIVILLFWRTSWWSVAVLTTWCQTSLCLAFLQAVWYQKIILVFYFCLIVCCSTSAFKVNNNYWLLNNHCNSLLTNDLHICSDHRPSGWYNRVFSIVKTMRMENYDKLSNYTIRDEDLSYEATSVTEYNFKVIFTLS